MGDNTTDEHDTAKQALFDKHPSFVNLPEDHGFFVGKVELDGIWLIDYFGGAANIAPEDYYANTAAVKAEATYKCSVCAHVYDAAADGGGAAFEDLPEDWTCPVCHQPKSAYQPAATVEKAEATYKCSVCAHVYDAAADGGGAAFE